MRMIVFQDLKNPVLKCKGRIILIFELYLLWLITSYDFSVRFILDQDLDVSKNYEMNA